MQIEQALTVVAIAVANLGTVIGLFCYSDRKSDEYRKESSENLNEHRKNTQDILNSIKDEMKDFHTKLATQDIEFKMRLCDIEERSKGKK